MNDMFSNGNNGEKAVCGHGPATILFVDDEEEVVNLMKSMLTILGYQPMAFNNSQQAYTFFERAADEIDCVILDHFMPQLDGMTLAKMIKSKRPDIPIIIVSGFRERINKKQAEDLGIFEFIEKPFKREKLHATIESALGQKRKGE
jgi:two-component system cell cycle sensor histidine kinase/response regulator CckA